MSVVLPDVTPSHEDWGVDLKPLDLGNFTVFDKLDEYYYGGKAYLTPDGMTEETYMLTDADSHEEKQLDYPDNFPSWSIGSGSEIVMQNRYYEWKSYTQEFGESSLHDLKLTRVDGKTGEVEIVDEMALSTPFVYLCKVSETQFLSYYMVQMPSDKTDYAVLTVATLYEVGGDKKEIIRERYENGVDWSDSEGILLERLAVKNGEIYGFGRRRISDAYEFFLYHYSQNGELLATEELTGFGGIIGDEQPVELELVGDYIVFRTYESLTNYICKKTSDGVRLIMKGESGNVLYAISDKYIIFIERNVDDNGELKAKGCPLYIIDTQNDKIKAVKFSVPLKEAYAVNLYSLSNGDLIFVYGKGDAFDLFNREQFLLPSNKFR